MFDEIMVRAPLPGTPPAFVAGDHRFQTKCLENVLDLYEITEDGRLMVEKYDVEDRSDPTLGGLAGLAGCMTRVNQRWAELPDFHGDVFFYTNNIRASGGGVTYTRDGEDWESVGYRARFTDGRLTSIKLLEHERGPASLVAEKPGFVLPPEPRAPDDPDFGKGG